MLKSSLIAKVEGKANDSQYVCGDGFRLTVLSDTAFRIELNNANVFEDNATQVVWFRKFDNVDYKVETILDVIYITTGKVKLAFNATSKKVVNVKFLASGRIAKLTNSGNLKGTRRTLDMTFGAVKLEKGLISTSGLSEIDDSKSLLLLKDGMVCARQQLEKDTYLFAYDSDYQRCIDDLYAISGRAPLVPRYALGVWWSRYKEYTQQEYIELIQRFEDEDIPLTVATIDMDWHWVDISKKFVKEQLPQGAPFKKSGWTGYSWNTDLFPDYKGLLKWLKSKNLKVTLNLHPADGVRYFEDMYAQMAAAMGVDANNKQTFDIKFSDDKYLNNYFDVVHKPYEKDGVDFWWIDWQQGKRSDIKGLDPLWALNHYHYLDNGEKGQLPLILSRYSGVGSHRYPLGFSGDSAINWKVLNFQPYLTATASNVGYTWWSHDIGGHHFGYKDDDLYVRWAQFGVFSPIMRLHSTKNDLLGKEPWLYSSESCNIVKQWLRLRHRLIPYIYTMDYLTHSRGKALIEPMYYANPNDKNAYAVKNQYRFGSQLLVCPITTRQDAKTHMGSTKCWLPSGRWTDIFTGQVYQGDKITTLNRDMASIPVLAKQGAIIPLSADNGNGVDNPVNLQLLIYRGVGSFELYEDDGSVNFASNHATTAYDVIEDDISLKFIISKTKGDISVVPQSRNYKLVFCDIKRVNKYSVKVNDKKIKEVEIDKAILSNKTFEISLDNILPSDSVVVEINKYSVVANLDTRAQVSNAFSRWQSGTTKKSSRYKLFVKGLNKGVARKTFLPRGVKNLLEEIDL